jgi:hypothetical protein
MITETSTECLQVKGEFKMMYQVVITTEFGAKTKFVCSNKLRLALLVERYVNCGCTFDKIVETTKYKYVTDDMEIHEIPLLF